MNCAYEKQVPAVKAEGPLIQNQRAFGFEFDCE